MRQSSLETQHFLADISWPKFIDRQSHLINQRRCNGLAPIDVGWAIIIRWSAVIFLRKGIALLNQRRRRRHQYGRHYRSAQS